MVPLLQWLRSSLEILLDDHFLQNKRVSVYFFNFKAVLVPTVQQDVILFLNYHVPDCPDDPLMTRCSFFVTRSEFEFV
jgi:hypothetical protein